MADTTSQMTEPQYRALKIDSYSSLKVFVEDRKKYYKKFVLEETVKDTDSQSLTFGTLVDCLLFTPDEFENKFCLSVTNIPKPQYKKLVDELMRVTEMSLDSNGEVTRELEDMLEEAYLNVKYDYAGNIVDFKRDSFEVVKTKFIGSNIEMYYRQLRESYGKEVIESSMVDNALAVINELKSNPTTQEVINMVDSERFTVYNQLPIVGNLDALLGASREGETFEAKCLPDRIIIDHRDKIIWIYDLKTVWDNENEFVNNYLKYKYYLQASLYYYLVMGWKLRKRGLEDYVVKFPQFMAADSTNYKMPLIYTTTQENFNQGMRGFTMKGRYYPGVIRAALEIMWHKKTGIWNISRENHLNAGMVKIHPFQ